MKVEVIEMRRQGKRVEVTPQSRRYVGYLHVFPYTYPRDGRRISIAALHPEPDAFTRYVLEELEDVRITALKGDQFVLVGRQNTRRGKKIFATWPQAWLCRPASNVQEQEGSTS